MKSNPMQRPGKAKVEKGDRVSVAGTIDRNLFLQRELRASSVVTLSDASAKAVGGSGEGGGKDSGSQKPQQ